MLTYSLRHQLLRSREPEITWINHVVFGIQSASLQCFRREHSYENEMLLNLAARPTSTSSLYLLTCTPSI